jgi:anti-sigma factor RsiW
MSKFEGQHPAEDLLLRYVDGELKARKARQVRRHLESCWQCRSVLEDLEAIVAECVRYRKNVLEAHLPPPPNAWQDLYRAFDRVDAETAEPWLARMARAARLPASRVGRWMVGAAATALMIAASLSLYRTDSRSTAPKIETHRITEPPDRGGATSAAHPVEAPARPAVSPSRPAANPPEATASISDELHVLSALHRIGADLGDPVEVTRSASGILVSGVGIAPERQKQIHSILDRMPHVAVKFTEPAAVSGAGVGPGAENTTSGETLPAIQARIEQQLGGRPEFERFSAQVLDWNEAAMSHAYALRALAQRFPAEAQAQLGAEDRRLLREMAGEHAVALASQLSTIRQVLAPVLARMGGSAGNTRAISPAGWQAAAEQVFVASRRVEVLLSVLLGVTPAVSPVTDLPSQLLTAIRELRNNLDECQRLLQEAGG